jgi:hypothetical protein
MRLHFIEAETAHRLSVHEIVGHLLGKLRQRLLKLGKGLGHFGDLLHDRVQVFVAALEFFQRIHQPLLAARQVPGRGGKLLGLEPLADVFRKHRHALQFRGNLVARSELLVGGRSLLLPFEQIVFGKFEVTFERFQIRPGGEVGHAVFFGALHNLFGALQSVGEILIELAVGFFIARGVLVPGQRCFEVVAQQIDHARVEIANHIGDLLMLAPEIFKPQPHGTRGAELWT